MGNLPSLIEAGSNGTQVGLMMGTDICNNGAVQVNWFHLPETDHPVIPQNLYRLSGGPSNDERFEQIGQSWAMHQFFPLQQNACGFGCTTSPDSAHLGVGCSTSDTANLNASQSNLGSRAWVNPFTGIFPATSNSHAGHTHDGTTHRILVEASDLNTTMNPGAKYYGEAQLIAPHEYAWCQSHPGECNMYNNASYRQFAVAGTTSFNFSPVGATVQTAPAIFAWPGATILTIEPAQGVDGKAFLAYKVTQTGPFLWHYEFAIYNQNLDRGINYFSVPAGCGIGSAQNIQFHAPLNHPGIAGDGTVGNAGYSNTPWTTAIVERTAFWYTETFAQNPNANALRWGTMYNFRFDGGPPSNGTGAIGFFKTNDAITVSVPGPVAECTPTIPPPSPTVPPTPSPTPTATGTPTPSPTPTPTATATATASSTPTPTPSATPIPTPSATPSPVPTPILPPGGNGKIAFRSARDRSDSDIYVMNPDGSNVTNLTLNLFLFLPDAEPDWSPDGTKIAFSVNNDEFSQNNIVVMDANGTNAVSLTHLSKDFAPAWSPDGKKIAFESVRDGNLEIYVMNADGSNPINLTNNPASDGSFHTGPCWSPDGGKIAFASDRGGSGFEIYVMNADGSNPIPLTNMPGDDTDPDWSPDGTKIAFTHYLSPHQDVYVMNADGSNPIPLTDGPLPGGNFEPAWSPDGTKIVFTSNRDPGKTSNYEVYVMNADGSNETRLTNDPGPDLKPDWQRLASLPSPTPPPTATPTASPTPTPPTRSVNLSTRLRVQTGENVGIGGFIITGSPSAGSGPSGAPKQVLLRAIGPSLAQHGITGALADPVLELHGPNGFVTVINDNWRDNQEVGIFGTGAAPENDLESAILAWLEPGTYTAIIKGKNNTSGIGLVEIYDLDTSGTSKLANMSTRGFVQTGDNVMIAGFVLHGVGSNDRIAVRGLGPSLANAGLPNVLANPTLELRDSNGVLIMSNNDWQDTPTEPGLVAAGLAPTNPLEAGFVVTLPPGIYTALLAGVNNGTGLGLVEIYDLGMPP